MSGALGGRDVTVGMRPRRPPAPSAPAAPRDPRGAYATRHHAATPPPLSTQLHSCTKFGTHVHNDYRD